MAGKMDVDSYRQAGELFIKLAKGEIPLPKTTDEAIGLLESWGIRLVGYDEVVFHQSSPTTLHVVIPRKDEIEKVEAEVVSNTGPYEFPEGVETIYQRQFTGLPGGKPKNQEFFEFRIGDYVLSQCR